MATVEPQLRREAPRFKPIVKRDIEVHLKFLGDWGVANWHGVVGLLAAGMQWRTSPKSTFVIHCLTPKYKDSLEAVWNRDVDVCVSTPVSSVYQAREGLGPFREKHPDLVTFARMAHRDRLILALARDVCEKYGIWTFQDIAAKKPPLRIVSAVHDGVNSISWTAEEIFKLYGIKWDDIAAWGGEWIMTARPHDGIARLVNGTADGLFFEAVMNWHRLNANRPLHFFPIDDFVLAELKAKYGIEKAVIAPGEYAGIDTATPVIEFGDWILAVRRDMPDEIAYLLTETIVDDLEQFLGHYRHRPLKESPVDYSVGPEYLCRTGPVPLHPGAERFYRERGLL
jgi:TRAP-type uncharacterized transport system substrate-binding protein